MTVSTTVSTTQASPNGVTTVFPINYRFFTKNDLKVFWLKPDGTVHLLILDSEYTVQGAGNESGGSITTIGTPLNGGTLTIARIMTATQLTSFRNQGEFFAEIHEDAFDKLVMLVQQTIDSQGRGLTVPVSDPVGLDLEMPGAPVRANKVLGFDAAGSPIQSSMTLEQIEQQPALAVASAQAAAASANTATAAATSASESAQAAEDAAASVDGRAGRFFGEIVMLPNRQNSPNGVVKADGQWITNATAQYPTVVADLQSATPSVPVVASVTWDADPLSRVAWVWDAANDRFRVPDWNGMQPGSIGPLMFRGDGTLGFAPGKARMDQMQRITGTVTGLNGTAFTGGTGALSKTGANDGLHSGGGGGSYPRDLSIDSANSPGARTGTETFGKHGVGVWGVVLFGSVSNPGAADAAALATSYANQQAAITSLQAKGKRATVTFDLPLGTNGGTQTLGAWRRRPINTISPDALNTLGVSVTNDLVVVPAGRYKFNLELTSWGSIGSYVVRIFDTSSGQEKWRSNTISNLGTASLTQPLASLSGEFNMPSAGVLSVDVWSIGTQSSSGMGFAASIGNLERFLTLSLENI